MVAEVVQEIGERGSIQISVERDYRFNRLNELEPAKINWPCIGSTTPENTMKFIDALTMAYALAKEMDQPYYLVTIVWVNEARNLWYPESILVNNKRQVQEFINNWKDVYEKHDHLFFCQLLSPQELPEK
jgi:hypothetical protein